MNLERLPDGRVGGRIPVGPQATTAHGALSIGAVATLVDDVAGVMAAEAQEAHAVTSQLGLRLAQVDGCTGVRCESRVVRAGRALVTQVIDITDEGTGRSLGAATMVSAVLPSGGSGSHNPAERRGGPDVWTQREHAASDITIDRWLEMEVSGQEGDTTLLALPLHMRLRNVVGVLHGGAQMLLVEQAALLAAAQHGSTHPVVDDVDVDMLAPGTIGPLTMRARLVGAQPARMHFVIDLTDEGNDGRLVALALAGVTP
jgi:uncharacterized protein (TIGR00369 family)